MSRDRVLMIIKKYYVVPMAVLALILYIIYRCVLISYRDIGIPTDLVRSALGFIQIVVWVGLYFIIIRNIRYHDLTGRNYFNDRSQYHLGYFSLVAFWKNSDPYKMDISQLPYMNWRNADGVILGHIGSQLIYRPTAAPGNLLCVGLPGSGKTTSTIIPTALCYGHTHGETGSTFVIDIKGDIYQWTHKTRRIKTFDLRHPESSHHYDLFAGIKDMTLEERIEFVEQMSYVIIPDVPGASDGSYFTEGGRDMMCAVFLYCINKNPSISFSGCIKYMLQLNAFDFISSVCAENKYPEAAQYVASYIGSNERNVAGCWNKSVRTLRQYITGPLGHLLTRDPGNMVSPSDLDAKYDLYIELPEDKLDLFSPIVTLITEQVMDHISRRKDFSSYQANEKKPQYILLILDEFAQYSFKFENIRHFLSTSRSKGASAYLAMQSIASLSKRYGDTGARELLDTIAFFSIMSAQDTASRRYFSDLIGEKKVLKTSSSGKNRWTSSSHTVSEIREPIIRPADFGSLGDKVVIYANGRYVIAEKTYCFEKLEHHYQEVLPKPASNADNQGNTNAKKY